MFLLCQCLDQIADSLSLPIDGVGEGALSGPIAKIGRQRPLQSGRVGRGCLLLDENSSVAHQLSSDAISRSDDRAVAGHGFEDGEGSGLQRGREDDHVGGSIQAGQLLALELQSAVAICSQVRPCQGIDVALQGSATCDHGGYSALGGGFDRQIGSLLWRECANEQG